MLEMYQLMQESLLLSIFPREVATSVQKELRSRRETATNVKRFRKLHVSRFDNVR